MSGLFPWANIRKHKATVEIHTLLHLHGNISTFIRISEGKLHDVNVLDEITSEAGVFYVFDRGYLDFARLYRFTLSAAFFVTRTKHNVVTLLSPRGREHRVRSDQIMVLATIGSARAPGRTAAHQLRLRRNQPPPRVSPPPTLLPARFSMTGA